MAKIIYNKIGKLKLKNPLEIEVIVSDEETLLINKHYNIYVYEKDFRKAESTLEDTIIFLKEQYYEADNKELTKDAQKLKKQLKKLFL